ncbi:HAMP domain-containing protein [Lentzea tibetensis]|uniref:histidine kinase n=1 Tax=Lentzea tibetensis TaxID=2591470 RepID=A0A563EYK5_9PSEU|nr:nitrate- and nitrite sensing domain-containing protein [Lentzea tibetensis]TWP52703.1 HAMP domain-containing protein [Lentzea tibetensis]
MIQKIVDWRNWRLPVKLAAVLVVPVTIAIGAGVLQIQGYVERADSYAAMQRLVKLRSALLPVLNGVQAERWLAAEGGASPAYTGQTAKTEVARTALRQSVDRADGLGEVVTTRLVEAGKRLDGLPALREQVRTGEVDRPSAIGDYSEVVDALLDVDEALGSEFGDAGLSRTAVALHEVANVQEQVRHQQAIVLAGLARGQLLGAEIRTLYETNVRLKYTSGKFAALVTPAQLDMYWKRFNGPDIETHKKLLETALTHPALDEKPAGLAKPPKPEALPISPEEWKRVCASTAASLDEVAQGLLGELRTAADKLRNETSDQAGGASVILFASLIVAITVGFIIGRTLLRSLNTLRRAALNVAWNQLPKVVSTGRAETEIEPVPVHTTEELGELARAFDAVHQQAVRAAIEQAGLRANMRNIFVNLSRRSQSLVERQLKLMEELEKFEEDPEQLANLFKLDHLATRMRRNNENLMVLSGSDATRRFTRSVPLADVLRAGAQEIEQYQRVVVLATPSVDVLGYVAGDLVRLIAELLDNGAAFSPPHTQVMIGARAAADGSVQVEIIDSGIGMSPDDLVAANDRLAAHDGAEVQVFREMGLFVVGRLAARHRVSVRLHHAPHGTGVRAVVDVPAELVPVREQGPEEETWSSFRGQAVDDGAVRGMSWFENSAPATTGRQTPEQARGFLVNYQRGVQQGFQESR